ncbi:MAG: alpha/beta hydrolase [Hyphomonas sp.]
MDMTIEQLKAVLKANQDNDINSTDIAARRAGMEASTQGMRPKEDAEISTYKLNGVEGLKITPANAIAGTALLYLHGGGYILGSPSTHKGMVSYLADAMQATAFVPDYRLGPEAPFPAAVDDALSCYRALLDEGYDPAKIIIAGDSAGGGLTLATALKAKDQNLPRPAGLALISPWANLNQIGHSYDSRAQADPWLTREGLSWMADQYLGPDGDADDPYATPVYGDLHGLPPIFIQVGSDEVLFSDSLAIADRAGASEVAVTLETYPNMIHVFQAFYPFLEDARRAITRMGEWARNQVA